MKRGSQTPLPDGWRAVRLGDVARETNQRADLAPEAEVFSVTKHSGFVRSLEYFDRQVFSRDTANYKVVRRGELAYATIHLDEGSLGILREADVGLISPMYTVFEPDSSQVAADFLFALMKLPQMVARYQRIGEGTVHRRKSISFERLGRLTVALPPLAEQRAIAAVLDAIDEAIERTEAVVAATERLRDALLHELLTRGLPGRHTSWREVAGLGTLPASWEAVRLGDVAEVNRGISWAHEQESSLPKDGALPVVRIGNVQPDGFRMDDVLYIQDVPEADRERRAIKLGTLVMVGSNGNRDRVGNVFLANDQVAGHLLASFLIAIVPAERVSAFFLAATLRWHPIQSRITESTAGSTGLKNLSLRWLRNLAMPLPPLAEQQAIAETLDSVDASIERARSEAEALQSVKAATADALLTGRARVAGA